MSTTQVEIELYRQMGSATINLGQQYHQYADFLEGKPAAGTPNGAPAGVAPPPPPFPSAAPVGGAPATPPAPGGAAAPGGRKRRTKAEIAADEAAVAAGFLNAADQLARTGGAPAGNAGLPPAPVQPVPGVSGNQPPAVPGNVAPPPPPPVAAPAPAPAPTLHDNLQAVLMQFGQAVDNTWPGQGHGNGQMGLVVAKMGVQNIQGVPAENVQAWIDWIVNITNEFRKDPSQLSKLTA